ncbi:retrovirus-related pol polyprotein from transposon TNT 1-94 [Tanacetum coccineum]
MIVESKNANHSEPNKTWGSNAIDIPSYSSLFMIGCPYCTLVFGLRIFEFVSKFLGTVRFGNDQIARIMGYGDYQLGNKNTCFIHNLEGVDLLSGSRDTNLYTISLDDMLKSSLICLLSKVSKIKSWLWHRWLSHPNFVDDYSRFTWVRFLKTKDEAPAAIIKCIKNIQVRLKATVRNVRRDNGTEFVNQTLREWYENVGITHQTSVARTPQQNGVVERRNQTLIEAARTMLIFSKASLFLWAEAINTACYTQNSSLIRLRYNKTPYELMQDKKPDLSFFYVFGSLCYPTNDHEDLGKFDAKADIGIFVGYAPVKKAFKIYNRRTRIITETIHVTFDELTTMASEQFSSGPRLQGRTLATSKAAAPRAEVLADSLVLTSIDQDAPSTNSTSQGSSSNVRQLHTPLEHLGRWTKDHLIANMIGDPSRFVSTRNQLETDAMRCYFDAFLTSVEPKNFKQAMIEQSWIDAMQEEIHAFERLKV